MVFQRATGGNTTYFLGDVTNKGWKSYFPIVYAIKEPLVLHILTIIALLFLAWQTKFRKTRLPARQVENFLKNHFTEIAMLIFLAIYWGASITSNLNIGIRHILPTFPFVYILVSGQIKKLFNQIHNKKRVFITCCLLLGTLLAWYAFSSLSIYPYYLTYFNELIGGAKNGYIYVTDSNLDWGQDLKRLAEWVEKNNIQKIKIDYFGGANAKYYLGDKAEEWHADYDPQKAKNSWLAVSATFLQQNRAIATKGFEIRTDYYVWLNKYEPVTIIGNSIFVYYIP